MLTMAIVAVVLSVAMTVAVLVVTTETGGSRTETPKAVGSHSSSTKDRVRPGDHEPHTGPLGRVGGVLCR